MKLLYKTFAITQGFGEDSSSDILAFDQALFQASIHNCNLVAVSSILPERCQKKTFSQTMLKTGEIVFCVMARAGGVRGSAVFSGLGYALGYDKSSGSKYGFVLEGHSTESKNALSKYLDNGLEIMAGKRNFIIESREIVTEGVDRINSDFGCAIVLLIYR